jgi:hypothetical protein
MLPLVLFLACPGCQSGSRDKPTDPAEYSARIEAALLIVSQTEKDNALSEACADAAEVGVSEAVKRGVGGIVSQTKKDDTAAKCAVKLAHAGQTAAAVEVAKMIVSQTKRDETLKKLATGSN